VTQQDGGRRSGRKGPTKKKWQWTTQRRIMLLTQVSTTGVNAFLTSRDVPGQSQVEVWTNESTGILPVLFKSHTGEFEPGPNEEHPTHISTIAAMKKWLKDNKHLYTQGQEQNEPVDVDHPTETTGRTPNFFC